jgi:hypothetical protein
MPSYQKPVYDQFTVEFNSESKPQSNNIKKSSNLIYNAISHQITFTLNFN